MSTIHTIHCADSRSMDQIPSESVDLVITSPPYPMIAMWDEQFGRLDDRISNLLVDENGLEAFELMHRCLDKVWAECARILKNHSFACINIGDATRSIGGVFRLFSNHAAIIQSFCRLGFDALPCIIWRKQTNAPNKFMGSGMLPAGAYVTLEHEYILVFRKGGKRAFDTDNEKHRRRRSGYFWEERNQWFSDIWDFKGARQRIADSSGRERSGSYPFELAYRIINMYSAKDDTVCDPFSGLGTTSIAAAATERNSIGIDIDEEMVTETWRRIETSMSGINEYIDERLHGHEMFIRSHIENGKTPKYTNTMHGFPVVTAQEREIEICPVDTFEIRDGTMQVVYGRPGQEHRFTPPVATDGQAQLF